MKYYISIAVLVLLAVLQAIPLFADQNSQSEECFIIATHLMVEHNFEEAVNHFEVVLNDNPDDCESLHYINECYVAIFLLAEEKDVAYNAYNKIVFYSNQLNKFYPNELDATFFKSIALNQAALWGWITEDYCKVEHDVYKYIDGFGKTDFMYYTLGDHYLSISYLSDRDILSCYDSNNLLFDYEKITYEYLMENATSAFKQSFDINPSSVYGNLGLMQMAMFSNDYRNFETFYNQIDYEKSMLPVEYALGKLATRLYNNCMPFDINLYERSNLSLNTATH